MSNDCWERFDVLEEKVKRLGSLLDSRTAEIRGLRKRIERVISAEEIPSPYPSSLCNTCHGVGECPSACNHVQICPAWEPLNELEKRIVQATEECLAAQKESAKLREQLAIYKKHWKGDGLCIMCKYGGKRKGSLCITCDVSDCLQAKEGVEVCSHWVIRAKKDDS